MSEETKIVTVPDPSAAGEIAELKRQIAEMKSAQKAAEQAAREKAEKDASEALAAAKKEAEDAKQALKDAEAKRAADDKRRAVLDGLKEIKVGEGDEEQIHAFAGDDDALALLPLDEVKLTKDGKLPDGFGEWARRQVAARAYLFPAKQDDGEGGGGAPPVTGPPDNSGDRRPRQSAQTEEQRLAARAHEDAKALYQHKNPFLDKSE